MSERVETSVRVHSKESVYGCLWVSWGYGESGLGMSNDCERKSETLGALKSLQISQMFDVLFHRPRVNNWLVS